MMTQVSNQPIILNTGKEASDIEKLYSTRIAESCTVGMPYITVEVVL